jgi:hypothetical protein
MCSKNLDAVPRISFVSPSRCRTCTGTEWRLERFQPAHAVRCPDSRTTWLESQWTGHPRDHYRQRNHTTIGRMQIQNYGFAVGSSICTSSSSYFHYCESVCSGEVREYPMESTYLEHDEHLGSALLHFIFRVLQDVHTCCA